MISSCARPAGWQTAQPARWTSTTGFLKFNEPLCGLCLPRAQHVSGRQLRRAVQTAGRRAAGFLAGLAALRHRRPGDASLVQKTGDGTADEQPDTAPSVSRIISGQFPVFHLYVVWREPDQRGGCRRHHGVDSGGSGADELALPARTYRRTGLGRRGLRRAGHRSFFTIKK